MTDLRIISIDDNNIVSLDVSKVNIPLDFDTSIIQRVYIALMNTPGTMIDSVNFGGGANRLLFAKSPKTEEEGRLRASEVVRSALDSLSNDPDILNVEMVEYIRRNRGFSSKLKITTRSSTIRVEI